MQSEVREKKIGQDYRRTEAVNWKQSRKQIRIQSRKCPLYKALDWLHRAADPETHVHRIMVPADPFKLAAQQPTTSQGERNAAKGYKLRNEVEQLLRSYSHHGRVL